MQQDNLTCVNSDVKSQQHISTSSACIFSSILRLQLGNNMNGTVEAMISLANKSSNTAVQCQLHSNNTWTTIPKMSKAQRFINAVFLYPGELDLGRVAKSSGTTEHIRWYPFGICCRPQSLASLSLQVHKNSSTHSNTLRCEPMTNSSRRIPAALSD